MPTTLAATATDEIFKNAPDIIKAASQTPLGILALMVPALSVLAAILFRDAPHRTRSVIFVLLFLGVAAYACAITRESQLRPATPVLTAESKPIEVTPLLSSNPEWLVFIGQYESEAEAKQKQQAAAGIGFLNSEIFRQGGYLHLRFRFASRQEALDAAAKLKQAHISHEPDVSRSSR
ncbi:MAG: SPOR domain-containing protein [Chthoniobacterales bacterium]